MANNRAQILISAIDQTRAAFESIKRNLGSLTDVAKSVNGVLGNLGVAVSIAGLAAMVKSAVDTGDALDEMSQRVGVSVETLSVWKPAAEQAGVSGESFEMGLRKLATSMLETATGSETAARGFSAVNVEFKKQDGTLRATDQVLLDLADRFKAMPDSAQKTALAMQLFGKSGADLIPFLNQGRAGINDLAAELQALGVQMDGETAAQAGNFNDTLDKLHLATRSIGNQIIAAFLPAMNSMADGMAESAKQGGILRNILDGVVYVFKLLALGAATVAKDFTAVGESIGAGLAAVQAALKGNVQGAKAILADLKTSLTRRLDELAELNDRLFQPPTSNGPTPGIRPDTHVLDQLSADNGNARLTLVKAQADAESKLLTNALERQERTLDQALADRLISIRSYYASKSGLEIREIDADRQRLQALLAEQQRTASNGRDEGTRLRARAEIAKLESGLIILNNKRTDIEIANAHKAAEAERALQEELAKVRDEQLNLTGAATSDDRRNAIERQYRSLIERLRAEGDAGGVDTVNRLIDVKAASADLTTYEHQFNDALARMRASEESINLQRQSGLLTESQARRQILALHRETSQALDKLLPQLEAATTAIGPEAVSRVQGWKNEIAQVKLVVDDVALAIDGSVQNGFTQLFQDIGSGAKTAKEAFADFGRSVLETINRIAAQKLAEALFGSLTSGGTTGSAGGIGALVSSVLGFAGGGYVTGPGTSTSDSIPARLSHGEYVVNARAVGRLGLAFLDAINGLSAGPRMSIGRLGFADGGLVMQPAATENTAGNIRIVNVLDPALAGDYLNSSAGERVVMNLIRRNASSVRTILGS